VTYAATFVTRNEIRCYVVAEANDDDVAATTNFLSFLVSVSNDGINYGNATAFIVRNPDCYLCDGELATCELKVREARILCGNDIVKNDIGKI
jgi:hypothetical protein